MKLCRKRKYHKPRDSKCARSELFRPTPFHFKMIFIFMLDNFRWSKHSITCLIRAKSNGKKFWLTRYVCLYVCLSGCCSSYLSVCLKFLLCLCYFCYLFWLPFKFNLYLMFNSQILDRRRTSRSRMFDLILCDFFGLTRVKKCTMSDQVISSWIKYFLLHKCFCNIDIFFFFCFFCQISHFKKRCSWPGGLNTGMVV